MKQTTLPLGDEANDRPAVPLEAEQEQTLIELMAQAIAIVTRPKPGERDEPA